MYLHLHLLLPWQVVSLMQSSKYSKKLIVGAIPLQATPSSWTTVHRLLFISPLELVGGNCMLDNEVTLLHTCHRQAVQLKLLAQSRQRNFLFSCHIYYHPFLSRWRVPFAQEVVRISKRSSPRILIPVDFSEQICARFFSLKTIANFIILSHSFYHFVWLPNFRYQIVGNQIVTLEGLPNCRYQIAVTKLLVPKL